MSQQSLYELRDITQRYGARTVLSISSLNVAPGEVLAVVGPSGAGKSTLLRLLAFLEQPASGELRWQQRPVSAAWPDLNSRRQVTMVFQRPQLLKRSVTANIAYPLQLRGQSADPRTIAAYAEKYGLQHVLDARADTLSGGEMQRVALARALVIEPRVLLLDEPTANLDPSNIQLIESIVRDSIKQGTSVVIVTHNIFQARRLADRVVLLIDGHIVEVAATDDFFERPQSAEAAAFVRGDLIY